MIVVTDRGVLDQQLQDTIYQFEHKRGVVQQIDESSRQLAEALENAVPIIITTLQKFPFVSKQLIKLAEKRGETSTGTLTTRRCAVIIDEAHSSQGGETATELKGVLGGEDLREEAKRRAADEGHEDMEELFRSMAKRGRQENLSFLLLQPLRSTRHLPYLAETDSLLTVIRCVRQSKKSLSSMC